MPEPGCLVDTGLVSLDELLTIIATTSAADWSQLSPPTVTRIKTDPEDQLQAWLSGHESIAHLRRDLDVSVAWGAEQHEGPWAGIWGAWSKFPDRAVHGVWAEVLWRGLPVHRQVLAVADGGRYYLPAPTPLMDAAGDDVEDWVVDHDQLPLARLIDGLVHPNSDVERTLQICQIRIR